MDTATQDRIINVISWSLNVPSSKIRPYTRLADDLFLDEIDLLLLIAQLERDFNVFLTREEVERIETVQDASSFFLQKHAA